MNEHPLVNEARRYLRAIEEGATGERLRAFFADDAVVRTLPNRIAPEGSMRDLAEVLAAAERGQALLREQRYEVQSAFVDGDTVIVEVEWNGALREGPGLHAFFAMFLTYREGRIVSQRNYDCFEPFPSSPPSPR